MNNHWDQFRNKSVEFWDGVKEGIASQNGKSQTAKEILDALIGLNSRDPVPPDGEVYKEIDAIIVSLDEGEVPVDQIDQYMIAYRRQGEAKAKLKKESEKLETAKEVFVEFLNRLGLTSVKRGEQTITASKRTYQSVDDYDQLEGWVKNQAEPTSLYMKQAFIQGSSKDERGLYLMVKDAQEKSITEGKPVGQCYPEGLKVSVVDVVTIRKARKEATGLPEPQSMVDKFKKSTEGF